MCVSYEWRIRYLRRSQQHVNKSIDIVDGLYFVIFRASTSSWNKLLILVVLIQERKKKCFDRKGVLHTDNNSIPHSNKFDSNRRILDSRRSLREIKKLCARRTRGSRRVRLIHLGHLADGEMAFRVKACSGSGRIERPSSLRRQSERNIHVLQVRNFLIDRMRVVSASSRL